MGRRLDPRVFGKNLRQLNAIRGLSPTEVAKTISKLQRVKEKKIDPKWYRRLCREGVGQLHSRTKEKLHVIAEFFGIPRAEDLWNENLLLFSLGKHALLPIHGEYAVKLLQLLETGKHDYLRHLILTLYAMEFPHGCSSKPGQGQNQEDKVPFRPEYLNLEEDDSDDEDDED